MANVVVLGGSGFIGQRLVENLLEHGHEVRIADVAKPSKHVRLFKHCDIRDNEALESAIGGADVIYNLVAEHSDNVSPVSKYYDVNVDGGRNVLAAAEKLEIHKIIFTSTVAVYGLADEQFREESPLQPFNHYGKSKLMAETELLTWQKREPGRSLVIVRPTVVFGEGNRGNFYNLARQIALGRFIMIGNGKNLKSVAYVENLVEFMRFCLQYEEGVEIFNYADGPDWDMNQMVTRIRCYFGKSALSSIRIPFWLGLKAGQLFDLISAITGTPSAISSIRVRKFCANSGVSTERLSESGFQKLFELSEALDQTLASEFGDYLSSNGAAE